MYLMEFSQLAGDSGLNHYPYVTDKETGMVISD